MLKRNKKCKARKEKMMRKGAILDGVNGKVFAGKVPFENRSQLRGNKLNIGRMLQQRA